MHIALIDRHGDVDVKSAYVRGLDFFAVKIASGFYDNEKRGLPAGAGLMVVLSAETGFCSAVLLDNAYLTDLRTGLAGAVAARQLAPASVETVGVIGTGVQARYQLRCLRLVRNIERVLVWGRRSERVQAYVDEMSESEGLPVQAADLEGLVRASQVVITTTAATAPLVSAAWLHPRLHITAVGADLHGKQELEAQVLRAADVVVCDSIAQCLAGGELQHVAKEPAEAKSMGVMELGAVVDGAVPGRCSEDQVSVCDLTGMGVQDTAIAVLALGSTA
jgi:ornithine cyclodeaminase